jgi:hypothetical protein
MGFLKAVAVVTAAWYRSAVTGRRVEINSPDYPNEIIIRSGNADEDAPATISGGAVSSNVGSLELRSPVLGSAGYAWLELEGYDDQDPHTTATLSADLVKIESGHTRILGFDTGVSIGSDINDALTIEHNQILGADLTDPANVFPASLATLTGTQTLTNKTLSGASNTVSQVPYSVAYSGTTDANGFLTVTHGAGFTPVGGWAVTTNPSSSFALFWGIDTIGATTVRLRFANAGGDGPLVSLAATGRLFLVRP